MRIFDTIARKKGEEADITIPSEIVDAENIEDKNRLKIIIVKDNRQKLKEIFGTIKSKGDTQKELDEIDKELWLI